MVLAGQATAQVVELSLDRHRHRQGSRLGSRLGAPGVCWAAGPDPIGWMGAVRRTARVGLSRRRALFGGDYSCPTRHKTQVTVGIGTFRRDRGERARIRLGRGGAPTGGEGSDLFFEAEKAGCGLRSGEVGAGCSWGVSRDGNSTRSLDAPSRMCGTLTESSASGCRFERSWPWLSSIRGRLAT